MPVVCFFCNTKLTDGRRHGFFTPDLKEWQMLTDRQQGMCMVGGGSMAVHKECYDDFIRGSETSTREEDE